MSKYEMLLLFIKAYYLSLYIFSINKGFFVLLGFFVVFFLLLLLFVLPKLAVDYKQITVYNIYFHLLLHDHGAKNLVNKLELMLSHIKLSNYC